ncbi:MAG: NAD-dependent epimerase/dehydratase family protein [Gemmatimonadetes bacterium]|nr:NAD-dependent epimerase/dehydratase family protein [Gemmatimonadota bacterium]
MTKSALITGVAGFIGSNLADRLLADGWTVLGIDSFADFYDPAVKERNLRNALADSRFRLIRKDLNEADLPAILDGVSVVFHQAAQAGVRSSWGREFHRYSADNIMATQRLLEAIRGAGIERTVLASSSSVYGNTTDLPVTEESLTKPHSPYGVTKLAAEHLARLYRRNFDLSIVTLRYFTVYGPRQRPDMAFYRLVQTALDGGEFALFGTGDQTRDFTFVADTVAANVLAAEADSPAEVYNIGGGARVSLRDAIRTIEDITGRKITLKESGWQKGDVRDTWADCSRAEQELGYRPGVPLRDGLERLVKWYETHRNQAPKPA